MENNKILVNKIRCTHCGDIIESISAHDFKSCSCGCVSIDGGHDYLSRNFKNDYKKDFEELSIILNEKGEQVYVK